MKKLYFIRHGLSEMNKSGHFAGTIDTPLAEEGRAQAKMAGIKARELRIDLIVTSPLIRASETAEIIARQIGYPKDKIVLSRLLIERHWGDLEVSRMCKSTTWTKCQMPRHRPNYSRELLKPWLIWKGLKLKTYW
jgi:broad specificity phosphatase PhoE